MHGQPQTRVDSGKIASAILQIEDAVGIAPKSRASSPFRTTDSSTNLEKEGVIVAQDTRMRQTFKTTIGKELGICNHYTHIAVLIIHWAQELDTDLQCGKEAQKLNLLFRDELHYDSNIVVLDNISAKPQHQLHKAISDFVYANDGPEHSHLMILYYSGHGYSKQDGSHNLMVSGTVDGDPGKDDEAHDPNADWIKATAQLEAAEADTLVILDCCNAGNIMKSVSQQTRVHEIMTATGKDTPTERPGDASYTNALIESLRTLMRRDQQPFTTYDLHQMIYRERNWNTASLLWTPGQQGTARHIVIAPPAIPDPNQCGPSVQRAGHLDVRIALADKSNLTTDQVKSIAKELAKIRRTLKLKKLNICDIQMLGFTSRSGSQSKHMYQVANATSLLLGAKNRFRGRKRPLSDSTMSPGTRANKRRQESPSTGQASQDQLASKQAAHPSPSPSTTSSGDTRGS